MSNPSTNRWGINLFWYKFWYNDKISNLVYQQDSWIETLVLIYVKYGSFHYKNYFISKYWYAGTNVKSRTFYLKLHARSFRFVEYKNRETNIHQITRLRNHIKNVYYSRLWILRFQNWVVINFYFFQPPKSNKILKKINYRETNTSILIDQLDFNFLFLRQKLAFFYVLKYLTTELIYYKF